MSSKKVKSLQDLKARHKISNSQPLPKPEPEEDQEQVLFAKAMQGVKPLKAKGRQVAPISLKAPDQIIQAKPKKTFAELIDNNIEFHIEFSEDFLTGQVQGLDPKIFRKLKNGRFSQQGHLDLHGLNAIQAYARLLDFIRNSYLKGKRCVLVIPGRGKNSPQGLGILRQEIQIWLTKEPLRRVVLAFCSALPQHGGLGALYILLRKHKKQQGKIIWHRMVDIE